MIGSHLAPRPSFTLNLGIDNRGMEEGKLFLGDLGFLVSLFVLKQDGTIGCHGVRYHLQPVIYGYCTLTYMHREENLALREKENMASGAELLGF